MPRERHRAAGVQAARRERQPLPFARRAAGGDADGLQNRSIPARRRSQSSYATAAKSRFQALPPTLGDALRAFAADDVVRARSARTSTALLIEYKTDEWLRYCGVVSEWEREMYLEFMP